VLFEFFGTSLGRYAMEYGIAGRVAEMATPKFMKRKVRELVHLPPYAFQVEKARDR
jgi:hypothetical protein